MLRKLYKGVICALAVLLSAGIFCLIPQSKSLIESKANALEEKVLPHSSSSLWQDKANSMSVSSGNTFYGHTNVYKITDAEGLATLAYNVNHGVEGWDSGTYLLDVEGGELDLSSSLWTPIGTSEHPFKGIFYGQGTVISNISIDDISCEHDDEGQTYSTGLFGTIDTAIITDIRLGGWHFTNVSNLGTSEYSGTLVGKSIRSSTDHAAIINCYDESTVVSDIDGNSYPSVGFASQTWIGLGGSYDGASGIYTDSSPVKIIDTITCNTEKKESDVSSPEGSKEICYVQFYNAGEGTFRQGNKDYFNTKTLRVLSNEDFANSIRALLYRGEAPVLRCDAEDNSRYVIKPGYKANIEEPLAGNSFISNITFSQADIEMNFDYIYSLTRNNSYKIGYDQTFKTFFDANPTLKTRLGYTFEGLYKGYNSDENAFSDKLNVENGLDYQDCYPLENQTYYFNWTWTNPTENERSFKVKFAYASDESGKIESAFSSDETIKSSLIYSTENLQESGNKFFSKAFTSDQYTFKVKLHRGYRIKELKETNGSVNVTNGKATNVSGAYVNFLSPTGQNPYLANDSKNNDSFNLVSVSGEWLNQEVWEQNKLEGVNLEKEYSFTLDNVVGKDGEVVLVIERDYINIDITPIDFRNNGKDSDVKFTFELKETNLAYIAVGEEVYNGQTLSISNKPVLYVRMGEGVEVKISVIDYCILNYDMAGFTNGQECEILRKESPSGINPLDNEYYKTWTIAIKDVVNFESEFHAYVGNLDTRVAVNLLKEDGTLLAGSELDGIAVYLNDTAKVNIFQNTSGEFIGMSSSDSIFVTKNGKFIAQSADIIDRKGQTKTKALLDGGIDGEGNKVSYDDENYYYSIWQSVGGADSSSRVFTEAYSRNGEVNYTINIYFIERTFDIDIEYYLGGEEVKITELNYQKLFTAVEFKKGNSDNLPNKEYIISFNINQIGRGAIYYDRSELDQDGVTILSKGGYSTAGLIGYENDIGHGFKASEITQPVAVGNTGEQRITLKQGTYDTKIRIYFAYKDVELSVERLFIEGENKFVGIADGNSLAEALSSTFTFSYEGDTLKLVGNLDSISIHSQYYLIGWYLQNGESVSVKDNYGSLLTDPKLVDAIAIAGSSEGESYSYNQIAALVGRREVNVSYNAGAAGNGQLYVNTDLRLDKENKKLEICEDNAISPFKATSEKSIVYNELLNVSIYAFFNLGHDFISYQPSYGSMIGEPSGEYKYIINGEGWINLFNSINRPIAVDGYQDWSGEFAKEDEKSANVELAAQWKAIEYLLSIDDVSQGQIAVGDNIYYLTSAEDRNGFASYYIESETKTLQRRDGSRKDGYVIKGFKLSQNAGQDYFDKDSEHKFILTAEELLKIIAEENRFEINSGDSVIKISSLRDPAKYLLYLDRSENDYYQLTWDESKDSGDYGQDEDNILTINMTFDANPQNLIDALSSGALKVSRTGYQHVGWAIAANGNQTLQVFNPEEPYTTIQGKTHIVPIWKKLTNTTNAGIKFADDVNLASFYLLNSHVIANGFLVGDNVGEDNSASNASLILKNGEKVSDFKFIVSLNGIETIYSSIDEFNIDLLGKEGNYSIKFEFTIVDTLSRIDENANEKRITYTATSSILNFIMNKNQVFFFENDFITVYTGTSEFVESQENKFGKFMYRYGWDSDLSVLPEKTEIGETESYFDSFIVVDETNLFNVGPGKSLKMKLNTNMLGMKAYENLISNIEKIGNDYFVTANGALSIERAKFTISFPNGSAYYFEGEESTVYYNTSNYQFHIGNQNFNYTYDKLTLALGTNVGKYTGSEDHAIDSQRFNIYGLKIEGHENDLDNFEWNISKSSSFELLDSSQTISYNYQTKYLTSLGGILENLKDSYEDLTDRLILSNVVINDTLAEVTGEQGNISLNNKIVLSYVGNGTGSLKLLINRVLINEGYTVTFDISFDIDGQRQSKLKLLGWNDSSVSLSSLEGAFDSGLKNGYTENVTVDTNVQKASYYGILTDVLKINVNYNGGNNSEGEENETIFVSISEGTFTLANPENQPKYLSFKGYVQPQGSNLNIDKKANQCDITNLAPGKTEEIVATWKFNTFDYVVTNDELEFFASEEALKLNLSDFISLNAPVGVTGKTVSMVGNKGVSFVYSNTDESFTIVGANGHAGQGLSDEYLVTIRYTFSDGYSSPESVEISKKVNLTINRNLVDGVIENGNLIFNNSFREGDISIAISKNGVIEKKVKLQNLPKEDDSTLNSNHFHANITLDGKESAIRNAGSYNVTLTIDSGLQDVYQFGEDVFTKTLSQVIEKDEILLKDYVDKITLAKYFGMDDPSPITSTITIEDNFDDQVQINFTRVSGEAIGRYLLDSAILTGEDLINYSLVTEDFVCYYEILTPSGNLQIALDDKISYTYNGHMVESYIVSYDPALEKYVLTIEAGSDSATGTFDLYYLNGDIKISVPKSERANYTKFIEFSSDTEAVAGEYTLSANLTQTALDADWTGLDIADESLAKIKVNKRTLTVNSIEKVFDRTTNLTFNTISTTNDCDISLSGLVEYENGKDEVELSGSISKANVGSRDIVNLRILSKGRGDCYELEINESLKSTVLANSQSEISLNTQLDKIVYGGINNKLTVAEIVNIFDLTFSDEKGEGIADYIKVSEYNILNKKFSSGGYLKAGNYTISFKVESEDYTFGQPRTLVGDTYTKTYEVNLIVEEKEITISNSTLKIAKEYDSSSNLPAKFVGQNVNGEGSYYTASGLLNGDYIKVVGGKFKDNLIEANKEITLVYDSENDDSDNYIIIETVVGDITSVIVTFNKSGKAIDQENNLITFVSDGITSFENDSAIKISYNGDIDQLINEILSEANRMSRRGYTNDGYSYDGVEISLAMTDSEKAKLLKDVVSAGNSGLELDSIWSRDNYTLSLNVSHATLYIGGKVVSGSVTLPYYNDSIMIELRADEGYKLNGITFDNSKVTASITSGNLTNNAFISIEKILENTDLTFNVEEINVKIIVVYNQPAPDVGGDFIVSTNSQGWSGVNERTLSYSELIASDLPSLLLDRGFVFDYWTLSSQTEKNNGSNVWTRIDGANITEDNLIGFSFTAHWKEVEISLNFNLTFAQVKVFDNTTEVLADEGQTYKVLYGHDVRIEITSTDFYKWTGLSVNGKFTRYSGEPNNRNTGIIEIFYVQDATTVTITSSPMIFTIKTEYSTPVGTIIAEANGAISGMYMVTDGEISLLNLFGNKTYTPSEGTYSQTGWKIGENEVVLNANLKDVIKLFAGGMPVKDEEITLQAEFSGLTYTVTFDKTSKKPHMHFAGSEAGDQVVTRRFVYGSPMTGVPVLEGGIDAKDQDYVWFIREGSGQAQIIETFAENQVFTLYHFNNSALTLALEAEWGLARDVAINIVDPNGKLEGVVVDGKTFASDFTLQYFNGAYKLFKVDTAIGYELGQVSGMGEGEFTMTSSSFTILGLEEDRTITLYITPKAYTITINTNDYFTFTNSLGTNEINVNYDEDISAKFDAISLTREGYTLSGLKAGEKTFATFDGTIFTFSEEFVQGNIYQTDSSITLDAVWELDEDYDFLSASASAKPSIVYNGQSQAIAVTVLRADGKTITDLTKPLANGEKIKEVYYIFNGKRVEANIDNELLSKDVISSTAEFVVVLEDLLSGFTHEVKSNVVNVIISQTEIKITDAILKTYYTGSNVYLPTSENQEENYLGNVKFARGEDNNELSIAKVELIGSSEFLAGNRYSVKYYFNSTSAFDINNYIGLTQEGGFVTYVTDSTLTALVEKAQIVVSFNEKGFFKDEVHTIKEFTTQMIGGGADFKENITLIKTYDKSVKVYDKTEHFVINGTVVDGNNIDKTANFEFVVDGRYEIVSDADAYRVTLGSKYFDTTSLQDNSQNIVKITSFEYNGQTISVGEGDYNYSEGDKLILTIVGNGEVGQRVLILKGSAIKFNLEISGSMSVLKWTNVALANVNSLKEDLISLSEIGSREAILEATEEISYVAVVTDYKAVRLTLGDLESINESGDIGYSFVQLGGSITLTSPESELGEVKGFAFTNWNSDENGLTLSGLTLSASLSQTILPGQVTAQWILETPDITGKNIDFNAKIEVGATESLSVSDVLNNGIVNSHNLITYRYLITKEGREISNSENFTLPANTTSDGTYTLTITATREGYAPQEKAISFDVKVNRISMTSIALNTLTLTYQNRDLAGDILVTFTCEGLTQETLASLLNKENSSYYFTVSGQSESEIYNAGSYSLKFIADQTIFDLDKEGLKTAFDFTVEKAVITITQDDIPTLLSSKVFGLPDPDFIITVDMFSGDNAEEVTLTLSRAQGESVGEYDFTLAVPESDNFIGEIDGAKFTIERSELEVKVYFDKTIITTYYKNPPVLSLSFDELSGKWIVTATFALKNGDKMIEVTDSTSLTINSISGGSETALTGALYRYALTGVELTMPNAINVGMYNESDLLQNGNGNFKAYSFEGELEIKPVTLELLTAQKAFDRNDNIGKRDGVFSNALDGDEVYITGRYAQVVVGENVELLNVNLAGKDKANYTLPNISYVGRIVPREIETINFDLNNHQFIYGQIGNNSDIKDVLSLSQGFTFVNGTITDDIENGYVKIEGITLSDSETSGAGYLKAGEGRTVNFIITSPNFSGLRAKGYEVTVDIVKQELNLKGLNIVKQFKEGDTLLSSKQDTNLDAYIMTGDDVKIDLTKGGFDDDRVGYDKHVTIVLAGNDKDNYKVLDNVTGSITAYTILVNVKADQEDEALVSGGKFVSDGLKPIVTNPTFMIGYPSNLTSSDMLASLKFPTRAGYKATGWKYFDGNEYHYLNASNIFDIFKEVVQNATDEDYNITIYPVWQIEKYMLTFSGEHAEMIEITCEQPEKLEQINGTYYAEYYSNISVSFTGEKGYKIRSYILATGQASEQNLTDTGKNSGSIYFKGIGSNIELQVLFEDIIITFDIDLNLPAFTNRVDTNTLNPRFSYKELSSLNENNLPRLEVTNGTYKLSQYTYNTIPIGKDSLKQVVDRLYENLTKDETISLAAEWKGEDYQITFDPGIGQIEGARTISATYGQPLPAFPEATLAGRMVVWKAPDNKSYSEGDMLSSVGTFDGDGYNLTFTAVWENAPFDITITFDSGLNVNVNGRDITSGETFTIVYSETNIQVIVTPAIGYSFQYDKSTVYGDVTDNGYLIIEKLVKNSSINFTKVPSDNTLRLFNNYVASMSVKIDGKVQDNITSSVVAKTEQTVDIEYKAQKGYSFTPSSVQFVGSGEISQTISEDGKTLTIRWQNFVQGGTLSISAMPSLNRVSFNDVSDLFVRLTFGNTNMNVSGDSFMIRTGESLVINGVIAYGYTGGNLSTTKGDFVLEGSVKNTFSAIDNYYYFTATLSGFDEDFEINFSGQARRFNFHISILEGQEEYGQITTQTTQTIDFGSTIRLSQKELVDNFEFNGWLIDGNVVSEDGITDFKITSALRDVLEKAGEDGIVEIKASYARKEREISLKSTNKGGFTAEQKEENISIEVSGQTSESFFLGKNIDITLNPSAGYELSYVLIDGQRDHSFDGLIGNKLSIYLDLFNPISSIEIVFKASEINVIVQAGTVISYIENLGNSAGGQIFATDSQGNRLSEENYFEYEGEKKIGASYTLKSFTDQILYFEVVANDGFTQSLVAGLGMTINEINVNGKTIFAISGALDGSFIKARFIAKENVVKIIFVNEDEVSDEMPKAVHGGVIFVDSSSGNVVASPNIGDEVNAYVITGRTLNIDLRSLLSYTLSKDEEGNLKYKVYYSSDDKLRDIQVGKVEDDSSLFKIGYRNSSSILVPQVTTSATIAIYVQPKEYSLRFMVDRNTSLLMEKKIRYGESWSLSSLSERDKAIIFATKPDYTFTGYYTMESGYGTQYIDKYGEITMNWQHSGYSFNGSEYVKDANFDELTDTFTLYAGWIYNRSKVSIEIVPTGLTGKFDKNIYSFIPNLKEAGGWTSQDNLYYAEVPVGANLTFIAPEIPGYAFEGFTLSFDNSQGSNMGKTFTINSLELGKYVITAEYRPRFNIAIKNENGELGDYGLSFVRQEGEDKLESFDSSKLVSLVAKPNEGYKFLYWIDQISGEKYQGKEEKGEFIYTFDRLLDSQISLEAVFEGKTIEVTLNSAELGEFHNIVMVTVGGKEVDWTQAFQAKVGQTIVIKVEKSQGYGFGQSIFDSVIDEEGLYVFSYTFQVDKLIINGNDYKISLEIPVTKEDILITFNVKMEDPVDSTEISKAGGLYIVNEKGKSIPIANGSTRAVKFGDNISVKISANVNYKFDKIYLFANGATFEIGEYVSNGLLQINKELLNRFFDYNMTIEVYFARLCWTDSDSLALTLRGKGTDKEPYLISNAREFALVAQLVNSGSVNEEGVKYAECSYKVTNNINFEGRYWIPIGTEENPFAGKMELGSFDFKNVTHYKNYSNPRTSYSGLFWKIDKSAKISVNTKTFVIVISVISAFIFLVIVILIVLYLIYKKRKKRVEEIANQ